VLTIEQVIINKISLIASLIMHFKKNQLFLLFIIVITCLIACQSTEKEIKNQEDSPSVVQTKLGPFKKYYHKKGKYSLLVPEQWQIAKKKREGCGFISNKENSGDSFKEFLEIYVKAGRYVKDKNGDMVDENLSSEDWLQQHFEILKYGDPSLKVNERGTTIINGKNAPFLTFLKIEDNISYETAIYLLSENNKAHIITTISESTKKTFYDPRFKEMIGSLKF